MQAYYDSNTDVFTWGTPITAIALLTFLLHLGIETKTWVRAGGGACPVRMRPGPLPACTASPRAPPAAARVRGSPSPGRRAEPRPPDPRRSAPRRRPRRARWGQRPSRLCPQTWLNWAACGFSVLLFFAVALIYNASCATCYPPSNPYWTMHTLLGDPVFYLTCLLAPVAALLPRWVSPGRAPGGRGPLHAAASAGRPPAALTPCPLCPGCCAKLSRGPSSPPRFSVDASWPRGPSGDPAPPESLRAAPRGC